jgi:hypothetical protein
MIPELKENLMKASIVNNIAMKALRKINVAWI